MNPEQPPTPNTTPQPQQPHAKQFAAASHVTTQPDGVEGHGFDPRQRVQLSNEPGVVHTTRPIEPAQIAVSDDLMRKHEDAKKMFPDLNLSRGEYVLMRVTRHPIGLLVPVALTSFLLSVFVAIWILYPVFLEQSNGVGLPSMEVLSLLMVPLCLLVGIFGYIAVWVYLRNTFYLTNESVIQEIQHSLFAKHEQTASLGSIEDVSFVQNGVLQTLLNYGTIRLSTEGEETTYRFHYVANPKRQTSILNNAVEDFKNGRPVAAHD